MRPAGRTLAMSALEYRCPIGFPRYIRARGLLKNQIFIFKCLTLV